MHIPVALDGRCHETHYNGAYGETSGDLRYSFPGSLGYPERVVDVNQAGEAGVGLTP